MRRDRNPSRQASALVAVMVGLLIMAGLASTLMFRARVSRRTSQKALTNLNRSFAAEAGITHSFHLLKNESIDVSSPLNQLSITEGKGEINGVPYRFTMKAVPEESLVQIRSVAGKEGKGPQSRGFAVARLEVEELGRGMSRIRWRLSVLPEAPAEGS